MNWHIIRQMAAHTPAVGAVLGHYRLLEEVGKGGMGVVFRARDEQLDREVAVKVLPPGTFPDEDARKRFLREARIVAKLNHPNVAMAFDFGQQEGIDYLVTEYVSGTTLDTKISKESLVCGTAVALLLLNTEVTKSSGRDLKPALAVAVPEAGRFSLPPILSVVVPVWVRIEF